MLGMLCTIGCSKVRIWGFHRQDTECFLLV